MFHLKKSEWTTRLLSLGRRPALSPAQPVFKVFRSLFGRFMLAGKVSLLIVPPYGVDDCPDLSYQKGISRAIYRCLYTISGMLVIKCMPLYRKQIKSITKPRTTAQATYTLLVSPSRRCWRPWICKGGRPLLCLHHETNVPAATFVCWELLLGRYERSN